MKCGMKCGMNRKKLFLALCAMLPAFCLSCRKAAPRTELVVLAAASLTDVCAELKAAYEVKNPSVTLIFSFGGSGALQAQIESGAPADMFLSAATKQMNALEKQNLMAEGSVRNLLQNKVVLIAPREGNPAVSSFERLSDGGVKMIALGEPESVPVGQYAKAVFTALGNWDAVRAKANFAGDVRTVLSWVESGACEYGVVYATDAASSSSVRVLASAPEGSCPPVIYPVGIVRASAHQSEAAAFEDFLFSEEAAAVFTKAGFAVLESGAAKNK